MNLTRTDAQGLHFGSFVWHIKKKNRNNTEKKERKRKRKKGFFHRFLIKWSQRSSIPKGSLLFFAFCFLCAYCCFFLLFLFAFSFCFFFLLFLLLCSFGVFLRCFAFFSFALYFCWFILLNSGKGLRIDLSMSTQQPTRPSGWMWPLLTPQQ